MISAAVVLSGIVGSIYAGLIDHPQHSSIYRLNSEESALVRGATWPSTSVHIFTKCGIVPACEENDCPDDNCVGFETVSIDGANSNGCADPDFWSQCVQWDNLGFGARPPCATIESMCSQVFNEDTGLFECKKTPFSGTTTEPTAPDNCMTNTISNYFDP